jgi:hypothetical protein
MAKYILENFIKNKVRRGDIYIPATLFLLLKNNGRATKKQIAKLIYIFENKHSLEKYEVIVESLVAVILSEYGLLTKENELFILNTWPLKSKDVEELIRLCYEVSNGFFRNFKSQKKGKLRDF